MLLPCGHSFHRNCAQKYLTECHQTCLLCAYPADPHVWPLPGKKNEEACSPLTSTTGSAGLESGAASRHDASLDGSVSHDGMASDVDQQENIVFETNLGDYQKDPIPAEPSPVVCMNSFVAGALPPSVVQQIEMVPELMLFLRIWTCAQGYQTLAEIPRDLDLFEGFAGVGRCGEFAQWMYGAFAVKFDKASSVPSLFGYGGRED